MWIVVLPVIGPNKEAINHARRFLPDWLGPAIEIMRRGDKMKNSACGSEVFHTIRESSRKKCAKKI